MTRNRGPGDAAEQAEPGSHTKQQARGRNHLGDQHKHQQNQKHRQKGAYKEQVDPQIDTARSKPTAPVINDGEAQSLGLAQATSTPDPLPSVQPPATQDGGQQTLIPPLSQKDEASAASATSEGSKPSIAVIVGAAVGGIALLLLFVTLVAYSRCCRKRKATKRKKSLRCHGSGQAAAGHTPRNNVTEKTEHHALSRKLATTQHATSFTQGQVPQQSSEDVYPNLAMPLKRNLTQQDSGDIADQPTKGSCHIRDITSSADKSLLGDRCQFTKWQRGAQPGLENPGPESRVSFKPEENAGEGGDWQIDRCLSYYMKRHTRSSLHPGVAQEPPSPSSPQPSVPKRSSTATQTPEQSYRKSFKLPKTCNLLEKIRRLQMRLDDAALPKDRKEGGRYSNSDSFTTRASFQGHKSFPSCMGSPGSESSNYDASASFVSTAPQTPVEQKVGARTSLRSSSLVDRHEDVVNICDDLDVLGSSPAVSEPHPAFEYADYYDNYLPAPHSSVRLQLTNEDGEDGFAMPWQNQSPCKSSLLSPSHSTRFSLRHRSATVSLASPLPPPSIASADAANSARRVAQPAASDLSQISDTRRQSLEVDEVIRF